MIAAIKKQNNPINRDYLKDFHLFQGVLFLWILFIPLKNALYEICTITIIFMFICHVIQFKTFKKILLIVSYTKKIFLGLFFIMFCMLLSAFLGETIENNLIDLVKFFYRFVAILFILLYFYQQHLFSRKFIINATIVTLTLYAFDGFYQYITQYDLFFNKPLENEGITGPTFSRNIFGMIMAIYTTLLFYILCTSENIRTRFLQHSILISLFLLSLFLLAHSYSRASWLFFVTFISFYIINGIQNSLFSKKNLLLLVFLGVSILIIFYFSPAVKYRFDALLNGESSNRFIIWKETFTFVENNLWFGYGVDSSSYILKNTTANRVHNVILEILLYLGIFGLLSYILLFKIIYKMIYHIRQYHYAFFLTAYLVLLQFDGSLVNSKLHLSYFILLLFLILTHVVDQKFYNSKGLL